MSNESRKEFYTVIMLAIFVIIVGFSVVFIAFSYAMSGELDPLERLCEPSK